uniref:Putative fasciclin n=1 Tax=Latrodectus hesperus TaxID=256737 RepID=E7D1Z1_LATHE|nr:putative fasciclin [Latrodectus hesperus]
MKQLVLAVICVLATVVCSSPTREKRSAMALAGAGFPFGTGAFAGGGFGWPVFTPFDYPRAFMPMPISWPVFTFPKPWYEGENVCTTSKEIQDPKELQEWFAETSDSNLDYSHESEQCQGSNTKYVCFKRYVSNGESKMQVVKYECCHGFVRNPNGPGCIESAPSATTSGGRPQDYYYFPRQQESVSSSSSRSGVGSVPIQ